MDPKNAVTMDPWLVEGDSLGETRRRFTERKLYLDGLESNGAGDEAARGDPLPCDLGYRAAAWRESFQESGGPSRQLSICVPAEIHATRWKIR